MTVPDLTPHIQHDRTVDEAPVPIVALHQHVSECDPPRSTHGQESFRAVLHADSVLAGSFPNTLSPAVAPLDWVGYALVPERQLEACAVAYLGSHDGRRGWWLHYTRRVGYGEDGDVQHVVTLIAPCACGTYLTADLADENALALMLDELDTKPGAPVACDYRLRIRTNSYDDHSHTSVEPAF
jgi:hypothetical protein